MRRFHEPYKLTALQRAFLIPYFSAGALLDPTKGHLVAGLGDVTAPLVLPKLKNKMMQSESGRRLLKDKPLITIESLNLPKLRALPDGTLGKEYTNYMDTHGYSANERSIVRFMEDPDLAYTLVRYRQVHDFWHVMSGFHPTILGELALKCFEYQITGLPIAGLSATFGQLRLYPHEIKTLWSVYIPWARHAGSVCGDMMSFEYEKYLECSVEEVRKELNFIPPPRID